MAASVASIAKASQLSPGDVLSQQREDRLVEYPPVFFPANWRQDPNPELFILETKYCWGRRRRGRVVGGWQGERGEK